MSAIPGILERLMLTGRAKKYNKVHGISASGTIFCPKSRWIVLTSIVWQPFFDTAAGFSVVDYQLNLTSKNNSQNYIFRTSPTAFNPSPVIIDVYDIHDTNVIVTISKITDLSDPLIELIDFSTLPAQADNPLAPYGYGTTQPVMVGVQFPTNAAQIFPAGIEATQGSPIANNGKRRTDYSGYVMTGINTLVQPAATENAPLVMFTYFEINSKDLGL